MKSTYLFPVELKKKHAITLFYHVSTIILIILLSGCKKLTEVEAPLTQLTSNNVYKTDASAIGVMTAIYADMSSTPTPIPGTLTSLSIYAGFSADELYPNGPQFGLNLAYYRNTLNQTPGYGKEYWEPSYSFIFRCNDIIEGINSSTSITPTIKNELLGEAEFIRAYYYFYLVNLYGDVPLALTTNYKVNAALARAPKAQVYQQIIADLSDAQQKMSNTYLDGSLLNSSTDRVRPNKWVANALLSRVYLYYGALTTDNQYYLKAEQAATELIDNSGGLFSLSTLSNAFLRASLGNNEAIWQLQPVLAQNPTNSQDGWAFIPAPGSPPVTASISSTLVHSFEIGDQRKINWIDSTSVLGTVYYYPYKYKVGTSPLIPPVTEHEMLFRLGEQYLIRAEARAQQGNIAGAQADLNAIRSRAGLPNTTAADKASLLAAILHERQVELFTEMGHRWLDLKRTGNIDAVMGSPSGACATKGGTWNTNQQLYPLPTNDIQLNPNLKQNPGY